MAKIRPAQKALQLHHMCRFKHQSGLNVSVLMLPAIVTIPERTVLFIGSSHNVIAGISVDPVTLAEHSRLWVFPAVLVPEVLMETMMSST